jgi:hypothetical protein
MSKMDKDEDLIATLRPHPVEWPKKGTLHALLHKVSGEDADGGVEICYEDDDVIAFHELDHDSHDVHKWDVRVTVAPKRHVTTLLDLGIGDEKLTAALLNGVQQAALRLKLYETGFEVFAGVLPPFQEHGFLTFKIRSGKRAHEATDAAAPQVAAADPSAPQAPAATSPPA